MSAANLADPPDPVIWNQLLAHGLETEWPVANWWAVGLTHTCGLPTSVVPPSWHVHPELMWGLSVFRGRGLCANDPEQNGSAPSRWHRESAGCQPPPRMCRGLQHSPGPRSPHPLDYVARRGCSVSAGGDRHRRPGHPGSWIGCTPRCVADRKLRAITAPPRHQCRLRHRSARRSGERRGARLMGAYVKTTDRCRCKDRYFSVRAMRRDRPDSPHKLAEMLTRLTG